MKKIRTMTYRLPITKERLKEIDKELSQLSRKGEKVSIEWIAEAT